MNSVHRREFLGALAAAALPAQPPKPPNVVVILADDLGYGDLSAMGSRDVQTPNIDGLFRSGVRFDNFYSNSPVCSPTRAALLSGLYPDRAGVPGVIRTDPDNNWGYLSPDAVLLPAVLKKAGYDTAIVGKWHLGLRAPNTPNDRGFDEFRGFLGDMMDDYYTHRRHGHNYMRRNRTEVDPKGHATDVFTDWAVDYLGSRGSRPFFLYLAYNAPHTPIQPSSDWLAKTGSRGLDPKRAKIAALIEQMDAGIGRVLDALKKHDNTLVVFTSDNGGQLDAGGTSGALRGGKQDMYEGGIRVPMAAMWNNRIAPGTRVKSVSLTMDLMPTICEAAGVKPPGAIDGRSLMRELRGQAGDDPERDLVWVRREGGAKYGGRDYYALRRGKWKLVQNTPFQPYELFNLADDPGETRDLAQQETKIYEELVNALRRHMQRAGAVPWQAPVI